MKDSTNIAYSTLETQHSQFYQLTLDSPVFDQLKPTDYNLYNNPAREVHIHKMGFDQNRIFHDIRNYTHVSTNIVSYRIDSEGVAIITAENSLDNRCDQIFIYEADKRDVIESIFDIQLNTEETVLPHVDTEIFVRNMRKVSGSSDVFKPHYTDIYYGYDYEEGNEKFEIFARNIESFKAAIAHIIYLNRAFPEAKWIEDDVELQEGLKYKYLFVDEDDEDQIKFLLLTAHKDDLLTEYCFSLDYYDATVDIQQLTELENENMLLKLQPSVRSYRMPTILDGL